MARPRPPAHASQHRLGNHVPQFELFPTRQVVTDDAVSEVPRAAIDRLRIEDIEYVVRNLDGVDPELGPYVDARKVGLIGWLGASAEHAQRLAELPSVRAVVALEPFASVTEGRGFPCLLTLRTTPVARVTDDPTLLAEIAENGAGPARPIAYGPSARERFSTALGRVRVHFLQHLASAADEHCELSERPVRRPG